LTKGQKISCQTTQGIIPKHRRSSYGRAEDTFRKHIRISTWKFGTSRWRLSHRVQSI